MRLLGLHGPGGHRQCVRDGRRFFLCWCWCERHAGVWSRLSSCLQGSQAHRGPHRLRQAFRCRLFVEARLLLEVGPACIEAQTASLWFVAVILESSWGPRRVAPSAAGPRVRPVFVSTKILWGMLSEPVRLVLAPSPRGCSTYGDRVEAASSLILGHYVLLGSLDVAQANLQPLPAILPRCRSSSR